MVNPGIILLISLAVILTIAVIITLIWAGISISNHQNQGTGTTGPSTLPSCTQTININTLIQIPETGFNCIQNGVTGSLYYIGNLGTGQYDYVVAPFTLQPLDVCIGFCTGYTGGNCSGPNYNGQSAQDNFNHCMSQLSSTTCTPPIPIAAKGTTIFYAYSPTCNICDNCGHRNI